MNAFVLKALLDCFSEEDLKNMPVLLFFGYKDEVEASRASVEENILII